MGKLNKEWCRRQSQRMLRVAGRVGRFLGGALTGHRFVTTLLVGVIAFELALFGVGSVRRLENASPMGGDADSAQTAGRPDGADDADKRQAGQQNAPGKPTGSAGVGVGQAPEELDDDLLGQGVPPLRTFGPDGLSDQNTDEWIASWDQELLDETEGGDAGTGEDDDPDADMVDHLIRQGIAALTAGDMHKCVLSLEQARALSPNHPAVLYYMGMAYDKLLNPKKANEFYTQVFKLRDKAGKYFASASRRLSYGVDHPSSMRGKLAFGPYRVTREYKDSEGERVEILLPVLLAPGEELDTDGIYIRVIFFDVINNRRVEFAHADPVPTWAKGQPDWKDGEENLVITYFAPALTAEEKEIYGSVEHYGFVAKLYYQGEPLDCISAPSSLILHAQRLENRNNGRGNSSENGLLPDDGLEEAVPYSENLEEDQEQ